MASKKLNVLHLSTYDSGGAGIAAKRLHNSLKNHGVTSRLLVLSGKASPDQEIYTYKSDRTLHYSERALGLIAKYFKNSVDEINQVRNIHGSFEIFTTPKTTFRVESHPLIQSADIIHLHWVSNFIHYPTFFKKVAKSKKIVWTFHDMNPFLGGFHYEGDIQRNPHLSNTEHAFQALKKAAIEDIPTEHLHTIYLCEWMKKKSLERNVFNRFKSSVIANPFDFNNDFKKIDRKHARAQLNIPKDSRVLMFACQSIDVHRKGFDLLSQALNILLKMMSTQITLLAFGESLPKATFNNNVQLIEMGFISDLEILKNSYAAADYFVLPSREDNLPNVMIEAWACGTPVISYTNGGMSNHIRNGFNGYLVDEISPQALAEQLKNAFKSHSMPPDAIREYAANTFDQNQICQQIIENVYR